MPNKKVNVMVRLTLNGKQTFLMPQWYSGNTARLKEPPATGVFYLSWQINGKKKYRRIGPDPRAALAEMERQERILAGDKPASIVAPWAQPAPSATLLAAIDTFLLERKASQNPTSVQRMTKELENFAAIIEKKYLDEITRGDIFAYWNWLKEVRGSAPRTIYNRVQTVLTFLKNRGITGLLATDEMPEFDEKDVDYYTENNPDELQRFFAQCDAEQRLAFMFFLYSGCREREVMFACWDDIDFVHNTYTVGPKKDLGFRTKNGKVRVVPLPQLLIDGLKTYLLTIPRRRLIFVNSSGGPQGHFLYICKMVAFKAGLNCGHCRNKKGQSCKDHPVCSKFSLHRFRRTWATLHLLSGMPITMLQQYIGHSDLATLNRYLAHISAKSDLAKALAENMARMTQVHGSVAADAMAETVKL